MSERLIQIDKESKWTPGELVSLYGYVLDHEVPLSEDEIESREYFTAKRIDKVWKVFKGKELLGVGPGDLGRPLEADLAVRAGASKVHLAGLLDYQMAKAVITLAQVGKEVGNPDALGEIVGLDLEDTRAVDQLIGEFVKVPPILIYSAGIGGEWQRGAGVLNLKIARKVMQVNFDSMMSLFMQHALSCCDQGVKGIALRYGSNTQKAPILAGLVGYPAAEMAGEGLTSSMAATLEKELGIIWISYMAGASLTDFQEKSSISSEIKSKMTPVPTYVAAYKAARSMSDKRHLASGLSAQDWAGAWMYWLAANKAMDIGYEMTRKG